MDRDSEVMKISLLPRGNTNDSSYRIFMGASANVIMSQNQVSLNTAYSETNSDMFTKNFPVPT